MMTDGSKGRVVADGEVKTVLEEDGETKPLAPEQTCTIGSC